MVLTFIGREKTQEISHGGEVIGMVLKDMALEGLVDKAELESFNVPVYCPTIEEVGQVIEAERSFTIQTLKTFKMGWDANLQEEVDYVLDSKMRGGFIAKSIRSVFEPLLMNVFGKDIMDELFSRLATKASQLIELDKLYYTNLVMSMRKA
ncbi:hypothetical protein VNO78_25762 [Psophocarpus tetragonolobus]|uniref:Jasmonate O-methyltransferase n=1 Tax=Psophocarpus tetragonolobus TaxID=3891 RepID=A0AAN9S7P9_PSOTE